MTETELLNQVDFLRGVSKDAQRELALRSTVRMLAPGQVLWHAGAEAHGLYVVLEGEVRVVRSTGGRQHVIHTEGPGGTLGEVPLFEGGLYPATAIAARRSRCLVISRLALEAAIQRDPQLAFRLLAGLAARVRHLIGRLDGLATQDVTARLAEFLLRRYEGRVASPFITLGRSQAEVAEELGTVREVLVRALRVLKDAGLIEATGTGRFVVRDPEGLRALVRD